MFILSYVKLAGWVVGFILLALGCFELYHMGYDKAESLYKAQLQAISDASAREVAKEKDANSTALKTALKQVDDLQAENDNLNKELSDADVKAAADFNAKRPSLGVDSVRRLNTLGKHHKATP